LTNNSSKICENAENQYFSSFSLFFYPLIFSLKRSLPQPKKTSIRITDKSYNIITIQKKLLIDSRKDIIQQN